VIKKYNNFIVRRIWKILEISGSSPAQKYFFNIFQILIMSLNTPEKIMEMRLVGRSEIAKV
jgi:hypothetical protein